MIKLKETIKESDDTKYVGCPFCGAKDFDLVGLKSHIQHGDCEIYNNLEETPRLF